MNDLALATPSTSSATVGATPADSPRPLPLLDQHDAPLIDDFPPAA